MQRIFHFTFLLLLPLGLSMHPLCTLSISSDHWVIQFYGKCSIARAAYALFDSMIIPSNVSGIAIIMVYFDCGVIYPPECFDRMPHRNVVHWNAMVHGYVKCGDLESARRLCPRELLQHTDYWCVCSQKYAKCQTVVQSYRTRMCSHCQRGFQAYEFCKKEICPDELVIVALMTACSQLGKVTGKLSPVPRVARSGRLGGT